MHPKSKILDEFGSWNYIKDLGSQWNKSNFSIIDLEKKEKIKARSVLFMKKKENQIYTIKTKTGKVLKASADHPFYTTEGFIEASSLTKKDKIIAYPFSGVKYKEPSDGVIVTIEDISKFLDKLEITNKGNAKNQILNFLKKKNILPLRYNSPELPNLIKIMGFVFGDGVVTFLKKKKGFVNFYGKSEDLESIRNDLLGINFAAQKVYSRERTHKITTNYGLIQFNYKEESVIKKCTAFAVLLACLGVPYGKKTHKKYRVPRWIMKAPLWQKRLFLSTLFGAELSKPSTLNKYNFYCPQLNMNKSEKLSNNGIDFLNDMRLLLSEFGIKSNYPVFVKGNNYEGKFGKTIGLRLLINGSPKNLSKLYSKIGYEYNREKQKLACLAINYLKIKEKTILQKQTKIITNNGKLVQCRINQQFISFDEYIKTHTYGDHGFTIEEIEEITKERYHGYVYDITMDHKDHNFIANSLVTHNCGMRLIKTDLTIKDVQSKIKELVNELFRLVPAGVGCKSDVRLEKKDFKDMANVGAPWVVKKGFGWKQDLERIEDGGSLNFADSSKISDKAIKRGFNQLGTLGSGNHYLEVQVNHASDIFNKDVAKKIGIHSKDQILVMVHCGSRGVGHQIASDYLKLFDDVMKKYKIAVPDRELSCAPFNSDEGQDYYKAMGCAANMAYANRQVITHRIREAFERVFKKDPEELGMELIMDNTHNLARKFKIKEKNKMKEVLVHLKGATRSLGPEHRDVLPLYKKIGSLIVIGGSMETGSYLFSGTKKAEEETFGTTAHGAGRTMSRKQAKREFKGEALQKSLEKKGIYIKTVSYSGLAEEAGKAYKSIDLVGDSLEKTGISNKVIRLRPIGNCKGAVNWDFSSLTIFLIILIVLLMILMF